MKGLADAWREALDAGMFANFPGAKVLVVENRLRQWVARILRRLAAHIDGFGK